MASTSRKTGLNVLGDISWGTHVCLFYETKEDLLATLVPYFKAGLESKDFCVWAISEPLTDEEVTAALREGIPDFDRYLAEQSIEILPGHEWYLDKDRFDLKKITGGWNEKLRGALAKGYKAMRVSGNAFWLDTKYWKDFVSYEREFDEAIAGQPIIVLCTYPLTASRAADLLEVADAHQFAMTVRKGDWAFLESAKVKPAIQPLTPREREVLAWAARGKSAWEIGGILSITKRTVDEHVQTAMRKLGALNRTQAVAIALRDRLIDVDYPGEDARIKVAR